MASRNKILKQVDRLAQRGNHADAAATLLKLVEENPRDVTLLNRVGDLYVRAGRIDQAIQQFETIAAFFKDDGFLLKAIAIYTKISKLDPARNETYLQLGELYAERGLLLEAKQNLLRASEGFRSRGNSGEARKALERLEKLDPDDSAVGGKLLDLLEAGGDTEEASARYLDAARKLVEGGRKDDGLEVLEKALGTATRDPALLVGMADLLLQTGNAGRAAGLLDRVLPDIEEPDLEFLLMLGRAKRDAGNAEGARAHFEEALKLDYGNDRCHVEMALCYLAGADTGRAFEQCHHVFNRPAESKSTDLCLVFLEQFLEAEPLHLHALRELAVLHRDSGEDDAYLQVLSRLAGACHQGGCFREELLFLTQLSRGASGDAAQVLENRREEAEKLAAGQTGALDETLIDFLPQEGDEGTPAEDGRAEESEAEPVYDGPPATEANGSDRVILGAEEVMTETREPEIELIIEDDQFEDPGDGEPAEPETVVVEEEAAAAGEASAAAADTVEVVESTADEAALEDAEDGLRQRLTATRVFLSYGMLNKALGQVEDLLDRFPGRGDVCELAARIYQAQGRDADAEAMRARTAEVAPAAERTEESGSSVVTGTRASWMNGDQGGTPAAEGTAADEPPVDAPPGAKDAAEDLPDPLSEDLEEVDFFISQGFTSEARDLIQGLLKTYPDHARLQLMLEQVGGAKAEEKSPRPAEDAAGETAASPRAVPAATGPGTGETPVAEQQDAVGTGAAGSPLDDEQLSEVFSMFQEQVAGQVDDEDFGTHYDLGIAYKEMMLVDEAIGEFQIAARSTEKRLDCCCMLGACFMEKGMPGEAIKWYEKGIAAAETGSEETKGLQFDLAAALEADGATAKALEVFQALASIDGKYRDVSMRIERLISS